MDQKDEKTWGILISLAGIIGLFFLHSVGNILAVLILWLIKRNESSFLDMEGKEALNFQITLSIVSVIINIFNMVRFGFAAINGWLFHGWDFSFNNFGWTLSMHGIVWVFNLAFSIIAAIKANNGEMYKYPLSIRLVK